MKYLKPDEIERWIDEIKKEEVKDIALLMWKTGARIREILLLRVRDIDFQNQTISMPTLKRGKRTEAEKKSEKYTRVKIRRTVYIPYPDILDMLKRRVKGKYIQDKIFTVHRSTVWRHLQKAAKETGISIAVAHPHTLRHSFAVACLNSGMKLPVLQRLLGHAQLSSTGIYLDILEEKDILPILKGIFGREKDEEKGKEDEA